MDFQVVVLAGDTAGDLVPLVSEELPKALLPVADRPVLSYVLDLLEDSNLKDIFVVLDGDNPEVATRIGSWISSAYADRLNVEVATVPEDAGTAGALRALAPHLHADDILLVSGDLITDVPPGAVAATHRRHNAVVTALLCSSPVSGPSDAVSGGKDKAKKHSRHNIVGLDSTRKFLLHVASGPEIEKDIRVHKSMIRAVGQMELRVDLMDAHLYAFKRSVLQEVLEQKSSFDSIQRDVLPYLVRSQLRSEVLARGADQEEDGGSGNTSVDNISSWVSEHLPSSLSNFHDQLPSSNTPRTHKCCAYIASKNKYCARLNSIQAFGDINHDVIGDASHISGYSFSAQNNIVHPSVKLGVKTMIGQNCMIAEGSQLGDKCNVKRSVIGRHCRIGSNVKILNSVVMNHVNIEDGCTVQGSVICSNVQLQEGCVLRDCQVGAGYVVIAGSEHRGESLARK
ncbi:transferases/nucleotidyltransferase [Wolffia australiana]